MTPHGPIQGLSLKRPPWNERNEERGEENLAKIWRFYSDSSVGNSIGSSIASSLHNSVL